MYRTSLASITCVALMTALVATTKAEAPYAVGHIETQIPDPNGLRPINLHVLYPTISDEKPTLFGDNAVLYGFEAIDGAPRAEGRFPLILISHGSFGKWSNEGWLAASLARSGMIIAAPDHPGTAWDNKNSLETPKLWERPRDLSRIIDFLGADEEWRPSIDLDHIGAIGHSLGGHTVMALAGARSDWALYRSNCEANPKRADCRHVREVGIGDDPADYESLDRSLLDPRLTAAISLDLGLAQAFDPNSVAGIDTPILLIGAGHQLSGLLAVEDESRYLATMLPKATSSYREIADISHFSFFAECKPGAIDRLAAAGEGDEIICQDGGGRDRQALHAQIEALIKNFLRNAGFNVGGPS